MPKPSFKKTSYVSPADYAEVAVLAATTADELLARLEWVTLKVERIVDIGCGPGLSVAALQKRYPHAEVIGIDASQSMVSHLKMQSPDVHAVVADAYALPFPTHSVDLIFANMILPWLSEPLQALREWRRVLRPEGLLVFSSLGPDTLRVWHTILANQLLPDLTDMHTVGDWLVQAKFSDPVMDTDYMTYRYQSERKVLDEWYVTGMTVDKLEHEGLLGAAPFDACYEIVYGHAWGPGETVDHVADEEGVVRIPLAHLRRRR